MTLLDISKMRKAGPSPSPAPPEQPAQPTANPSLPEIRQAMQVEQMMMKTPDLPKATPTPQIPPAEPVVEVAPSPPGPQTVLSDPNYENIIKALKETEWLLTQDKTKALSRYEEIKTLYHNLNHDEKEKVYNECLDIFSKLG